MSVCCVNTCHNNYHNNRAVKYYTFPMYKKNNKPEIQRLALSQRMAWIRILRDVSSMTIANIQTKRVCSAHFISGEKAEVEDVHNPDWVPTQNLSNTSDEDLNGFQFVDFVMTDDPIKGDDIDFDPSLINIETSDIRSASSSVEKHLETLKDIEARCIKENNLPQLKSIIDALLKVIEDLNFKLRTYRINIDYFRNNDKKTLYYTGLPKFILLEGFIAKLAPHIGRTEHNVLTTSQMLILTLMKLRLGLQFTDLGYRFGVSTNTACRTFYTCLNVMYFKMKGMVYCPPREEVMYTMPASFKKHFGDKVCHIIDCLEIPIEAPYYLDTRIQCWSEYKSHFTIKYLISITPQGMIQFISYGYGGRASDMYITTHCGFLDVLQPDDFVLADKGFNMHDVFEMRRVGLEIPAFVYQQHQLHPLEIERTRKIANVRIHVERVIGFLKRKFLILHRVIPITMLSRPLSDSDDVPLMDKILTVCSALCNLCPSIVYKKADN